MSNTDSIRPSARPEIEVRGERDPSSSFTITRDQNFKFKLDPSVGDELRYRSVVLSDAWPSVSRMVAAGAPR
jgi:hypothetical protein